MRETVRRILDALGCPDGEVSLSLVSDEEIESINRDYRRQPRPTNVIAFSMREGAFSDLNPDLLGDVVVSVDTCRSEAEAAGIPFADRLEELVLHGMLHLFGYDHEQSPEAETAMWRKTDAVMAAIRRSKP